MADNHISEDNPIMPAPEHRIANEIRNNYQVLFRIEQRLEEISNALESNTANIEILEEAISTLTNIPTRSIEMRYNHKEHKLWINERFFIPFDGKQADVFGLMFNKSNGKPKMTTFQCSSVADTLFDHATGEKPTLKAISQTALRIQTKLNSRLSTKNVLTVTSKEFYFSRK
jgi:hypothetical protein